MSVLKAWNGSAWVAVGVPATVMTDPTTTKGDLIVHGGVNGTERLAVSTDGYVLTADSTVEPGVSWKAATTGSTVGGFQSKRRSSTSITVTSTTFAALDTSLDVTVAAATGDIILIGVSTAASSNTANALMAFDVQTIVSGSAVNTVSGGLAEGVTGWRQQTPNSGQILPVTGCIPYTVVAGDVSAGNVTLRIVGKTNTGTMTVVCGSTNGDMLLFWAKNLLH